MGFHLTESLPRESHPTAKNRVRGFFGETQELRLKKSAAAQQPRWENRLGTTKLASGVRYYGYRYYDPVTGRWPSRDPIEERGGISLYVFAMNGPIHFFDVLGLQGGTHNHLPDDPPYENPDTSDGFGFYEAADHYFNGGGNTIDIPFSQVDPGWEIEDILPDPCRLLAGSLQFGQSSPSPLEGQKGHQLFSFDEILIDSGDSGPGGIIVQWEGNFYFHLESEYQDGSAEYSWLASVYFSSPDNEFDWDPKDWGERDYVGEAITRTINTTGGGDNFTMTFSGGRNSADSGSCCCKQNSSGTQECSPKE